VLRGRFYEPGAMIGAYQVIRPLTAGGMGVVYEARPRPERRQDLLSAGISRVALKVASLDLSPEARHDRKVQTARFEREFELLHSLTRQSHPNVISVYDFGWEGGIPHFVMEWVDGITLGEALAERPHLEPMLYVFAKLCDAVKFLHESGICHRDLKLSNVLIRKATREPVLIDFGVSLPPGGRTLTWPKDLVGTPWYLSPEYAEHLLKPGQDQTYVAGPTDDVWALGIILYQIVTGRLPWLTPPGRNEALLQEIQTGRVRHPCEVAKELPQALGEVVMGMLHKIPGRRIQTGAMCGPSGVV